jgi:predicted O-methyltransferase YrrM
MSPEEIFSRVGNVPFMHLKHGCMFYDFITSNHLSVGLELGFLHGVSTAYLAGAIQELGCGDLTTIDVMLARDRVPNIHQVLDMTGLTGLVRIFYEPRSFNWRLMRLLEDDRYESFDFCYINTSRTWYDTGLAFCLVERLLRPGGWVVFNDLHYNFRESSRRDESWVKKLPEEEQTISQIERVFELLAEQNPYFGSYRRLDRFGFAQKQRAMWSREQRALHRAEVALCRAADRAYIDPDYRESLLLSPLEALSSTSGEPANSFKNLRFVETDCRAPLASTIDESDQRVVYLERPAWVRRVTEAELLKMLENG